MKRLLVFFAAVSICCTMPNSTENLSTKRGTTLETKFLENPQKTYIVLAGALEWKDALHPFDKKNRKDAELERKFLSMGVPAANIISMYDDKATLSNMNAALDKVVAAADENSTLYFIMQDMV
jgi:hypothetical protein